MLGAAASAAVRADVTSTVVVPDALPPALVLVAKVPTAGRSKTRLAARVGGEASFPLCIIAARPAAAQVLPCVCK